MSRDGDNAIAEQLRDTSMLSPELITGLMANVFTFSTHDRDQGRVPQYAQRCGHDCVFRWIDVCATEIYIRV